MVSSKGTAIETSIFGLAFNAFGKVFFICFQGGKLRIQSLDKGNHLRLTQLMHYLAFDIIKGWLIGVRIMCPYMMGVPACVSGRPGG